MAAQNYAVVQECDGLVSNIILWDPANVFEPGEGLYLVPDDGTARTGGTWDGERFLPPPEPVVPLGELKEQKKAELNGICREHIISGFTSCALGEGYHYPSDETDQLNLSASVTASLYPGLPAEWRTPFLCRDEAGVWGYHDHSADQIQQVGEDGKAAILAHLTHKAALWQQVDEAETAEEVRAVQW